MATKYYVCHGPSAVHYSVVEDGCSMNSGQPNIEEFTSENEATLRAIELGYVFPEEEEEDVLPELEM